jgi:hypothetical protein
MTSSYLTSNPIFEMLENERDVVTNDYDFNTNKFIEFDQKIIEIEKCDDKKLRRKKIKDFKIIIKRRMITIMKELELENIRFTKKLTSLLVKLRDFYIDISAREEAEKKDEIVEKEEELIKFISLITDKTKLATLEEKNKKAIDEQRLLLEEVEEVEEKQNKTPKSITEETEATLAEAEAEAEAEVTNNNE